MALIYADFLFLGCFVTKKNSYSLLLINCLSQWRGEIGAKVALALRLRGEKRELHADTVVRARRLFLATFFFFSIQIIYILSLLLAHWKIHALPATETVSLSIIYFIHSFKIQYLTRFSWNKCLLQNSQ